MRSMAARPRPTARMHDGTASMNQGLPQGCNASHTPYTMDMEGSHRMAVMLTHPPVKPMPGGCHVRCRYVPLLRD